MTANALRLALIAGLVLPLTLATAAFAEEPNGGPGPDRPGAHMMRDPAARAAAHAQHLRDALQLRPDQEGALNAFLQATHPDHRMGEHRMGEGRRDGGPDGQAMSTPERMDHMLAHMDEMRARMVAHVEATKRFYAQLTPAQQRAFDALPMHGGGMHGGGMHGMHGGPMGGHGPGGHGGPDGDDRPGGPPPHGE